LQTWVDQLIDANPHLKEIRHAERSAEGPGGFSISAKKDYLSEPLPAPNRTPIPFGAASPMPGQQSMPAPPPVPAPLPIPVNALGNQKKAGEIVSRSVPRVEEKMPTPLPGPAPLPTPAPGLPPIVSPSIPSVAPLPTLPRDPFDPAEFNSRPK
jgi:hypothetical protein